METTSPATVTDTPGPLAPLGGARPPAPAWFHEAIARAPQAMLVRSHQTDVEVLIWGERGNPGVLLVHGAGAHAHWWAWTAPLLAESYRVAAMSLPGSGGSQWRDRYSSADFDDDAAACARAAGLWDAGMPVYIGHSMGGAHLFHAAVHHPQRMRGLVLVDTSFRGPAMGSPEPTRDHPRRERAHDSEAAAVSRFRLMPPQPVREPALVDYVARMGLRQSSAPDGRPRWIWRRDPDMLPKLRRGLEQGPYPAAPLAVDIPILHVMGDRSHVVLRPAPSPLSTDVPRIVIPDCYHHIMLDRPLALVAVLRALLAVWPRA